jgi:hypothetical protein
VPAARFQRGHRRARNAHGGRGICLGDPGLGAALYGGPVAAVKQFQVTFDCAEPERVARFWCEVLGYVVPPPPEGFATWGDFDRSQPPEDQGSWFGTGLVGEERLAALEAECARLVPLGAVRVRLLYDGNDSCIVMQDIEGNEFCLD